MSMVMENLGRSLRDAVRRIIKASTVDEKLVNEVIRMIQRALITSDVEVRLVFDLTNRIKKRALKEKPPAGLTAREHVIKILYDELVNFLGKEPEIHLDKRPLRIMLLGLFGSGKTTTTAKIAWLMKKRGMKVLCVQTDTWRPAAYHQLKQLCSSVGVDFYGEKGEKDPKKILKNALSRAKNYDVIIVDTAGRDALDDVLIKEAKSLYSILKPDEVLLVLSGDIGQNAKKQAQAFHDAVGVTGVVVTKLDGTAKGGGALSACAVTDAPVKFIGTGEKYTDIELFDPKKFVSRLLGLGDLDTLLEKAKEAVESTKIDPEAIIRGKYTLLDFYDQLEAARSMGPLSQIMQYFGLATADLPKELIQASEEKMKKFKYILDSMTYEELENPDIINKKRIDRIAKGSGTTREEVKELLKNYNQSKKLIKMLKKGRFRGNIASIMRQFGIRNM